MQQIPDKYIKINLPLTEEDYRHGSGEGVWVEVTQKTRTAYDHDLYGTGYSGILANDSVYYPGLCHGEVIPFEMRGKQRPVADFPNFLANKTRLTREGKAIVLATIARQQTQGDDEEDME